MDFLSTAVWIFEFMVMGLLPFMAIALVAIYIYRILNAIREGTARFFEETYEDVKK